MKDVKDLAVKITVAALVVGFVWLFGWATAKLVVHEQTQVKTIYSLDSTRMVLENKVDSLISVTEKK